MSLSNSQYDTIQRDYDKLQLDAFHQIVSKKNELYNRDPEIKRIDESIASLAIKQAEKLLNGDVTAVPELKGALNSLKKQRESRISSLGYNSNFTEPVYSCPDCRDTGFVRGVRCHCFKQRAIDLVYNESNIHDVLSEENFDNFSLSLFHTDTFHPESRKSQRENMQFILDISNDFINKFKHEYQNLFFFGPTGVGKTFLCNCIAKELLEKGNSVIYFSAIRLFDVFRENAYNKNSGINDDYQNIFNCDLLIIDDLGTEVTSAYAMSQFFMCVNERILRKKSTIISSNLDFEQLSNQYSERTFSRIIRFYRPVEFFGDDVRIKPASKV